ncbi:uncharacterized protein LOC127751270 [Frankliniella occidentalis]|uniref:Uncharacterized protein LOC127751270 n=1 Tax=Frankliniella occidentalis TaxID=133901 RepID=A0A9C6XTM9_FRAOC|nr:uncharacterized protein LOC127751270 [Frankliniella occidentalis]
MVGRKKAWVRTYFDVTNLNGKKATSKCKFCEAKSSFANATRMLEHLANQCKKCPDSVKIKAQKDFKAKKSKSKGSVQIDSDSDEDNPEAMVVQKSSSVTNTSNPLANAAASSTSTSSAPAGMGKYILKTTEKQKQQLDEVLARAVYMAGQAFSTFESPYWKNAIELLRPGYEPPSSYRLRNSLLVSEYETVMDCTKEKIKSAECLAIIIDRWTNIRRENLINFIITTPEPVFLRAVPPGRNRETGQFLSNVTQ